MSEKQNAETLELADKLVTIFDRIGVSCDWRLSSEERQDIAKAAAALHALHAAAPSRCDRCGSSGDVFVLCSGCHGPIPSPHPRGEPVAWRFRLHGDSGWVYTEVDHSKAATSHIEIQPLYAAPPPAGADAVREALRNCIDILDEAQSGFIPGCGSDEAWKKGRDERVAEARALLPALHPQEKPTGDQT